MYFVEDWLLRGLRDCLETDFGMNKGMDNNNNNILLLLLLLFTAIQLSLGGSSPYTSTDKTNKNKYT